GSGSVIKKGNGTLNLNGSSSYLGATTISTGVLRTGNAAALGSAVGSTNISTNAALDVNGQNLGAELVVISGGSGPNGNGPIYNSGADQTQALQKVELLGNATFANNNNN